ncbi:hypothetical protein TCAL_14991 [Tigriopus californicus]|uniref:Uncharacterized protein n=1 Tax=Tigriopus californicus TaxID=6832 RepID=A0A553N7K2_TIGCA|nr:hypothetical protein TCAL_14991 [Tigriopus californicus]
MVLIELVYCKITGKTRSLPKVHHFVPIEPWSCRKIKGKKRVMNIGSKNDEAVITKKYEQRKDTIKLVLDMSNDGPMFRMLESMMRETANSSNAYDALNKLLKSGIPGISELFGTGKENIGARFRNMTDEDKAKFLAAVTGSSGKIQGKAAAVLIAAAASGGNPDVANKIVERMMSGLGDEIDPAMMAALMATTALVAQGASNEEILKAMQEELAKSGLSNEEILAKTMLLQKALAGDNSPAFINKTLQNALNAANITPEEMAKALLIQKAMSAGGISPEEMAKAMLIQKILAEKGVPPEMIAEAFKKLAAEGGGKSLEELVKLVQDSLRDDSVTSDDIYNVLALSKAIETGKELLETQGLSPEEVTALKEMTKAIEKGSEIPPEAVRLLKKAMKQRRGSVDNVAESLMTSLAAGGQNQESIVKAMVKALKATGASPEEIARTMQQAMQKSGASNEDIARAMSQALIDSGASADEVAKTLKETFAKTIADDPSAAPDVARTMAEALASAGASAEDIAHTMKEIMNSGLALGPDASPEDILEMAETIAQVLADAGALPSDIADVMKIAMEKARGNPDIADELARTMAQAMADAGASGDEIANMMREVLESSGISKEEAALMTLAAIASSGVSPQDIAKTISKLQSETGLSSKEIEQAVVDAMVGSGASAEDVAKAMAEHKLLEAIGRSADTASKELLKTLRSGKDMSKEKLMAVLQNAGITPDSATKLVGFQSAMACMEVSPEDLAKALLLQKTMSNLGASPEIIAKVMKEMGGASKLNESDIEKLVNQVVNGELNHDDVLRALKFDSVLTKNDGVSASVASTLEGISDAISKKETDRLAHALLQSGAIDSKTATMANALQQILSELQLPPDEASKFIQIQKSMYDAGASPQDIAEMLNVLNQDNQDVDRKAMGQSLREKLRMGITAADVSNADGLADAFQNAGLGAELIQKMAMVQNAIANGLNTPEQGAKKLAHLMKDPNADLSQLEKAFKKLLKENNLTLDSLEKSVLSQKVAVVGGFSPDDLASVFDIQSELLSEGMSAKSIAAAMQDLLQCGATDVKNQAQIMISAIDQGRLQEEDILVSGKLLSAMAKAKQQSETNALENGLSNGHAPVGKKALIEKIKSGLAKNNVPLQSVISIVLLQKVMVAGQASPEEMAKICRIQKSLIKNGAPAKLVCKTIGALLEGKKSSIADKMKAPLIEIMNNKPLEIGAQEVEFAQKYSDALTKTNLDSKKVKEVLENALSLSGLSDEDVAKAMLVQKTLAAAGVSPEALAQVMLLQKALADSGATPDEIASILSQAIGNGLSDKQIEDIMGKVLQNKNLSAEEVENMMKLQKNLKAGTLSKSGITPEAMNQIRTLQEALKAAGANEQEIISALALAATSDLSESEVSDLMSKVLASKGIDQDDFNLVSKLQDSLEKGNFKEMGLTPEIMGQLNTLEKAMRASGADEATIKAVMAKATTKGLSKKEINDIISKAMNPHLSQEEEKSMKELHNALKNDELIVGGLKEHTAKDLISLQRLLEKAGMSEKDIKDTLKKATSEGGLSENELKSLVQRAIDSGSLSKADKAELIRLEELIKDGKLSTPGMNDDVLDQVLQLKKALEVSGASDADIAKILSKATTEGLATDEINKIIRQAMKSDKLTKEDKQKLKQLEDNLHSGNLKFGGVSEKQLEDMLLLEKILAGSGASEEEIAELIAKSMSAEGLSQQEIADIMSKAKSISMTDDEKKKLTQLEKDLKSGGLAQGGVTPKLARQVLNLKKALKKSGKSEAEILDILAKATTGSLDEKQVTDIMTSAMNPKMTKKQIEDVKQIQDALSHDTVGAGIDKDAMEKLLLLQKILKANGASEQEIADILAQATTSGGLSNQKIDNIINQAKANPKLSASEKEALDQLEQGLKDGSMENKGLSSNMIDQLMTLQKTLEATGATPDEIVATLMRATGEGLEQNEIAALMDKAKKSKNLSKEDKKKLKELEKTLKKGNLKVGGATEAKMEDLLQLKEALKASGASDKEIQEVLAKVMKGATDLKPKEVANVMDKLDTKANESIQKMRQKNTELEQDLIQGNLINPGLTKDVIDQMFLLKKALKATGVSDEEIAKILTKATNDGLTKEEISNLLNKAMKSEKLSDEDKKKLKSLKKSLENNALKVGGGVSKDTIEKLLLIELALEESGANDEEIAQILAKATSSGLSNDEIGRIMTASNACLDEKEQQMKDKMSGLKEKLNSGDLNIPGMTPDILEQLLFLKKIMEANGTSDDEVAKLLAKAVSEGLSKDEIAQILDTASKSGKLDKDQKAKLKDLKQALEKGSLKIEGGVKKDLMEDLILLQNGLEQSGMDAKEVKNILKSATGAAGGISKKDIQEIMDKAKKVAEKKFKEEEKTIDQLEKDLLKGNLSVPGMTKENLEDMVTLQNVLKASGASDEEIKRIIKSAMKGKLNQDEIDDIISKAIDSGLLLPEDKNKIQALKSKLQDGKLKVDGISESTIDQLILMQDSLAEGGSTTKDIVELLAKATGKDGLNKDDIDRVIGLSKDNLSRKKAESNKQLKNLEQDLESNKLANPEMTPQVLDQILLLEKALEASGASQEEIADILAKATTGKLGQREIEDIVSKAMRSDKLTKEDKTGLQNLKTSLLQGDLNCQGVSEDTMDKILLLQKVLEASGVKEEEVKKLISKAISEGLNQSEIDGIITNAMNSDKLTAEEKKKLQELQKTLEQDDLKGTNLTKKGIQEVLDLRKLLKNTGISDEELSKVLTKATKGDLTESDKADILFNAMAPSLSEEEKEKLRNLKACLTEGNLRLGGINKNKAQKLLSLRKALEQAGSTPEEISDILAKAMTGDLNNRDISSIMSKILANPNLSQSERDKLKKLQTDLEQGNLLTPGVNREMVDQLLLVQKAMKAMGGSDKEIAQMIEKISRDGLSQEEINKLINNGLKSDKLSKEEKEKLKVLKGDLEAGNLTLSGQAKPEGINKDKAKQLLLLKNILEQSGATADEVAEVLSKAMKGGLSNSEIAEIMNKAKSNPKLTPAQRKEIDKLQSDLENGKLKIEGITPGILDQLLLVQKVLKASGGSEDDIAKALERITKGSFTKVEADIMIAKAMSSTKLSKEDKEKLQSLKVDLEKGKLKVLATNDQGGLQKDTAENLLLLRKVLAESGVGEKEIAKILSQVVGDGLNNKEIAQIMDKALADSNLSKEEKDKLVSLKHALKKGTMQTKGVAPEMVDKLLLLEKALKASGCSDEEIAQTIAKITKDGLTSKETEELISKSLNSDGLTKEDKKKLMNLKDDLIKGNLKVEGVRQEDGIQKDKVEKLLFLQDILAKTGASDEKISDILAKVVGDGLSEREIHEIISKAMADSNLSTEDKAKIQALERDLQRSNLKTEGVTPTTLDQLLLLQKAMKATGSSEEEIAQMIEKVTKDGLSKAETDKLLSKALTSKNLSPEDKEKLNDLKQDLIDGNLKVSNQTCDAVDQYRLLQKTLEKSGASADEIKDILALASSGQPLDANIVDNIMSKAIGEKNLSSEEYKAMKKLQHDLKAGNLKTPGVDKDMMEKVMLLQKVLEESGASPEEISNIIAKATGPGLSDEAINDMMSKVLTNENLSPAEREKLLNLQNDLKSGGLRLSDNVGNNIEALLNSGQIDTDTLAKALMVQKLLANAGLNPDDLSKAAMIQKAMMEAGASPESIAKALQESLNASGIDMEQFTKLMEDELKANKDPTADDVLNGLQFHKALGADSAAQAVLKKMKPEHLKLLEEISKSNPGAIKDTTSLINALKDALGDSLDDVTLQALQVSEMMEKAGASKDEIEEMMGMMMNKSGGISSEFLNDIKKAMESGGSPKETLNMLKDAMDDEINSLTNTLRSTFLNKVPSEDEISKTCDTLAEKLGADIAAKNDVRCGLMDIIEEALQDITDFEPDANMVFNYLMMSALAEAADAIEKKGIKKPSGAELQDMARENMLEMIRRLLIEAELPDEMRKLDVYGRSIQGIKELLNHLLSDPHTGNQLRRQVAFLFDFDEIQHTTILGLTLQDILKDAKHRLRPWELTKHRRIKGYRRAKMPKLAYSQVYCYYKVLPDHVDGPPIGVTYE